MKEFEHGLIVGKFCPLHKGHELLINHGLARCREFSIISYCKPAFPGFGTCLRELWLRARFPNVRILVVDDEKLKHLCQAKKITDFPSIPSNDAPDNEQREFVAWICWYLLEKPVDAVFTSEEYGDGFAAVLSQYFQARGVKREVRHICLDKLRVTIPTSGTKIRNDIHGHRHWLAPEVYATFIQRVCLLGGESSGKTTLAEKLAEAFDTRWVSEFGRELWEKQKGNLCFDDMQQIAATQIERETNIAGNANHLLFCDTSPLTTYFYSMEMFGRATDKLLELANRQYDHTFLCAPDFDFVQDGTRRGSDFRLRQYQWYLRELSERKIPYTLLEGNLNERLEKAVEALRVRAHLK